MEIHEEPFVLIARDFTIVAANNAYAAQYNVRVNDIIGSKCHRVSHNSERPCYEHGEDCPLLGTFQQKSKQEVLHVHTMPDGSKECVDITSYPIFDEHDEVRYMGESLRRIDTEDNLSNEGLIGDSNAFLKSVQEAKLLAAGDLPVLLSGESGVGKERFASYIHNRSSRSGGPFVALDCGGLAETLFESELFGHEAGAFTGAVKTKKGLFEIADGGTLFLDEIGELSLAMQAKLLRVLETGEFRRVGGTTTLRSNVRLVSATNRDLKDMVHKKFFRNDLYYRLAGHTVGLPPLRDRKEDIPQLACYFIRKLCKTNMISPSALQELKEYNYPGNLRELKYVIELATLKAGKKNIQASHLPENILAHNRDPQEQSRQYNRRHTDRDQQAENAQSETPARPRGKTGTHGDGSMIDDFVLGVPTSDVLGALQMHNGSRRRAARQLGITERKLYRLLNRYRDLGIAIPKPYQ